MQTTLLQFKKEREREFTVIYGPVIRTWRFYCWGPNPAPGQGTEIPQAEQHSQEKKKDVLPLKYYIEDDF